MFFTRAKFHLIVVTCILAAACTGRAQTPPNTLSAKERADGWKLLFDGKTTNGWRGYRKKTMPDGWQVRDGALVRAATAGDIVTEQQFDNFELQFDWKVTKGANSGVFYRASEEYPAVYESAPEYQVLDNGGHPDGKSPKTSAGSNYALDAPVRDVTKPVGEWNHARIVVDGHHVEHWMNGVKLLEYELNSPKWKEEVAASKFKQWPAYGTLSKGYIAIQDHGAEVAFRSIKVRPVSE